jgi:hypothetical protein
MYMKRILEEKLGFQRNTFFVTSDKSEITLHSRYRANIGFDSMKHEFESCECHLFNVNVKATYDSQHLTSFIKSCPSINKKNFMVWVRERTIPTERQPLAAKRLPTCADRGCHVVSVTDPSGRILGFLNRSRYFSIKQLLSCTHETEWTPFQTHYSFFSGSARNRTRASGSVAKNSDH